MTGFDDKYNRFPFVGFEGERYFNAHYIVNFGEARVAVTWRNEQWRVSMWPSWFNNKTYFCNTEVQVLGVLHHLKQEAENYLRG